MLTFTLRRRMWSRWLPPMLRPSPSPVMSQTLSSGLADLDSGRHRRAAPVDGVESVGVHVVGKATGAADPADDTEVFARYAKVGEGPLQGIENGVVSAARAPAHVVRA
jgi:hypothetical protein